MTNDTISTKVCSKCGIEKPATIEYFHRHPQNGLHPRCKECRSEDDRKVREKRITNVYAPSEELKQCSKCQREFPATKEYFAWHKHSGSLYSQCYECQRAARREERKRNDARYTAFSQQWYEDNHESAQEYRREYYKENRAEIIARVAEYQKNNPEQVRIVQSRREARKRALPDTFTVTQWIACLEYHHYCCPVCGCQLRDLFGNVAPHADHWIPLVSPDCPGTVAENMICLCNHCNQSKGAKMPEVWLVAKHGTRKAKEILIRIQAYFEQVNSE